MQTALKQTATVQKGGYIEIRSPELLEGISVEVIILIQKQDIDISDIWSDEDIRDLSNYSLQQASTSFEEEEIDV